MKIWNRCGQAYSYNSVLVGGSTVQDTAKVKRDIDKLTYCSRLKMTVHFISLVARGSEIFQMT